MKVMEAIRMGSWDSLLTVRRPFDAIYRDTGFTDDGAAQTTLTRIHYDGDPWWLTWGPDDDAKRRQAIEQAQELREQEARLREEQLNQAREDQRATGPRGRRARKEREEQRRAAWLRQQAQATTAAQAAVAAPPAVDTSTVADDGAGQPSTEAAGGVRTRTGRRAATRKSSTPRRQSSPERHTSTWIQPRQRTTARARTWAHLLLRTQGMDGTPARLTARAGGEHEQRWRAKMQRIQRDGGCNGDMEEWLTREWVPMVATTWIEADEQLAARYSAQQGQGQHAAPLDSQPDDAPADPPALRRSTRTQQRRDAVKDSRTGVAGTDQWDKRNMRRLAAAERRRYDSTLVIQTDAYGGHGLFARKDIDVDGITLSYYGTYYPARSYYLRDYPNDDAEFGMQYPDSQGELQYYDGSTVHGYMRYVNHASDNPNAEFYHTEDSPYVLLRLTRPTHANEEITANYGDDYPYQARGFSR